MDLEQRVSRPSGMAGAGPPELHDRRREKLPCVPATNAFGRTTPRRPVVPSPDGRSPSGRLNQRFFDRAGDVVRGDIVQPVGTRLSIDSKLRDHPTIGAASVRSADGGAWRPWAATAGGGGLGSAAGNPGTTRATLRPSSSRPPSAGPLIEIEGSVPNLVDVLVATRGSAGLHDLDHLGRVVPW